MTGRFEADELFFDGSATGTTQLHMGKPQTAQFIPEAEMPERHVRMTVYMHPLSAFTPAFAFRQVKISLKAVNCSSGCCFPDDGLRIMEAKQTGRNLEEFC